MNQQIKNRINNAFTFFLFILCVFLVMILVIVANKKAEKPEKEIVTEYTYNTRDDINKIVSSQDYSKVLIHYDSITNNEEITVNLLKRARQNNIPINLLFALARVESIFDQYAVEYIYENGILVSKSIGVMQLNTLSFPDYTEQELYDIVINIREGAKYLRMMYDIWGDWETALLNYNKGFHCDFVLDKKGMKYVSDVLMWEREYDRMFSKDM